MLKNMLKKLQGGVIATIALGMLGSAAFEFLFKPSMGQVSRLLLDIITFGSKTVKDAVYSSAALDPTPLFPLFIASFVTLMAAVLFPIFLNHNRKRHERYDKILIDLGIRTATKKNKSESADIKKLEGKTEAEISAELKRLDTSLLSNISTLKMLDFAFSTILLTITIAFYIMFLSISQSVSIWRIFHANMNICAPYITEQEGRLLKSKFAGMTTRDEFSKIEERLTAIAQSNNINLVNDKLW